LEIKILKHIEEAKKGRQTAFNFLLNSFWNDVYSFQLKRVKNEIEAEDITIETFSKAFDKINTYNEKYKFTTWLITISKNIHIDKIRKKKVSIETHHSDNENVHLHKIPDDSPSPEDKLITEQNLAQLLRFIKKLKPQYQQIINLRYFQEMSYKEISEENEESLNNVKVKLLRAKKLLAEIIQKNESSYD